MVYVCECLCKCPLALGSGKQVVSTLAFPAAQANSTTHTNSHTYAHTNSHAQTHTYTNTRTRTRISASTHVVQHDTVSIHIYTQGTRLHRRSVAGSKMLDAGTGPATDAAPKFESGRKSLSARIGAFEQQSLPFTLCAQEDRDKPGECCYQCVCFAYNSACF